MPARFSSTGLLWPTILAIVGFSVLVGLGLWQWDRKQWKADVLDRLAAAETAPPKDFSAWFDQLKRDVRAVAKREGRDCADAICAPLDQVSEEFDVVRLSARPAEKKPAFVYAPVGGKQTYRAFAYIETDAGPLQVDRGLIEEAELDAFRAAAAAGGGSAAVQDPG
ncbi:MAG: SURF1 family cytochrome oxidase biogenesis protein, partial [Pseudomonadota bacterium]